MGRLRLLVGVTAVVLGVGAAVSVLAGSQAPHPAVSVVLRLVIGWAFVGAGLVAWRRRPESRVGLLMCAVGVSWLLKLLVLSNEEWLFVVGAVFSSAPLALYGHLLLAFPGGRLESRAARVVVAVGYVDTIGVWLVCMLLIPDLRCPGCPINPLAVFAHADAARALTWGQNVVGLALVAAGMVILAVRWRRGSAAWRRVMAPVLGTALVHSMAAFAVIAADLGSANPYLGLAQFLRWVYTVTAVASALGCLVGLLRSSLDRAGVADLIVRLGSTAPPGELRQALAAALHDPSLSVLYRIAEHDRFVDLDGRPATLPTAAEHGRVATLVERDGTCIAALVHDPVVGEDPGLLEAVCAAAGFALDNERLQAELRARLDELAASRTRLVQAADAERRRIERNLHDGAQQRLVSVSMSLGWAAARLLSDPAAAGAPLGEARATLNVALQELRELSRGIHPGALTEHGLAGALQELVWATPLPIQLHCGVGGRLAESVETTVYYVVAEAVANIVKHAEATSACIRIDQHNGSVVLSVADDGCGGADPAGGSGLAGLADRVHALGGPLT